MFKSREDKDKLALSGAVLNLASLGWSNIEEAKNVAVFILLLGDTELTRVTTTFAGNSVKQRAIAIAMVTAMSKSGTSHLGKDGGIRLYNAVVSYAEKSGEASFFNELRKAVG
jgi:hypothetical protein